MKKSLGAGEGTILVVDDDSSTRRALRVTLSGMGYTVVEASRGEEAVSLVRVTWFDAVLLDVDMPGMGGVEACKSIRHAITHLPILMLSVLDDEDDMVMALEAGADDYITKPFQLRLLTARLHSAVRRRNAVQNDHDMPIRYGYIELDPVKYHVKKRGKLIHLTPKEFEMLHYLMNHAGEPVPHERLLRSVWGPGYGSEFEYLRTYMRQLRTKIEDDPTHPQYLLTEANVGYRFNDQQPNEENLPA
ncbi:response regulator transcription factor [Acidicapsa acidisoli]|uniref:response regulator transcription factor n=1 Tax=Acidicapsa acidisoli TaxID=1615681 RepID=UPI0021E0CA9B|nr:response regulator transcription factor [Acidicapsa acidisoli]